MIKILKNSYNRWALLRKIKAALFLMITVTATYSCKSSETEGDVTPGGITSVKVNITDVVFDKVNEVANKASINKKNSSSNEGIQRNTVSLNADYDLVAELSPELPASNTNGLTSKAFNRAATGTETEKMLSGVQYKIIAYENDGRYVEEKNYVRGQENLVTDFLLDGGKTYRFVVYSINSKTELPGIVFADNSNKTINTSSITVKGNVDFLYAIQTKTLVTGANNEVNVILKHKLSQITTTVDASATGFNITAIDAVINSHRVTATIALADGTITRSAGSTDATISFPALGTQTVVGTPTMINADVNNGSFTIKLIKIGIIEQTNLVIFKDVVISPGVKYNMKVNLVPTDGYLIHKNQSAVRINRQIWMRHNLGANYNLDPDQNPVVAGLHGNYYQWGRLASVATGTATSVNNLWATTGVPGNQSWNNGSAIEGYPIKTSTDPCPEGFRIPVMTEYAELIARTSSTRQGYLVVGSNGIRPVAATYYRAATVFTSNRKNGVKIIFPAQGRMSASDKAGTDNAPYVFSELEGRGTVISMHTSTIGPPSSILVFDGVGSVPSTLKLSRFTGRNIRCIAR